MWRWWRRIIAIKSELNKTENTTDKEQASKRAKKKKHSDTDWISTWNEWDRVIQCGWLNECVELIVDVFVGMLVISFYFVI